MLRWVRSEIRAPELRQAVAAMRLWSRMQRYGARTLLAALPRSASRLNLCAISGKRFSRRAALRYGRAHALYNGLFGQVEDLIRDKHLLIVPSGGVALSYPSNAGYGYAIRGTEYRAT
jgi:hypothetical protein